MSDALSEHIWRQDMANITISAAFDFENAFPFSELGWIWIVLQHRRFPYFLQLVKQSYHKASARLSHNWSTIVSISFVSRV